ncbi:MAG: AsmA family protein [Wenzhouxiangellaceae bacterium]|nr:AsmA family protein [Wenzhouxiangellaceae bacterium]
MFLALSALGILMLAVLLAAWLIVKTEWATERVEARLGDALGMQVKIAQPLQPGLFPGLNVTLADLELSTQGQVVAVADRLSVRLATLSLLVGTVRPLELHIERPTLTFERYAPGVFNIFPGVPPGNGEPGTLDQLSLRHLRVSDARLTWLDQPSGFEWEFEHCDLAMRSIRHAGGLVEQALATLATEGELTCGSVSQEAFVATGLSAQIHAENGVIALEDFSARVFEGRASGRFETDLSSDTPRFNLQGTISELELAALSAALTLEQSASGKMNLELELDAGGTTWRKVRETVAGTFSMGSDGLVLDGYDLDEELDNYADTQRFNLVDIGAIFLGGPLGLAATRGYAFSGLLGGSDGSTAIDRVVSEWTVEGGVAQARDVAFRTGKNRLALAGALDFVDYRFDDMRVAVVDRHGCAVVEQKISGPFDEPEIERPNFLVSAAGPMLDLVKRGVQTITDSDCKIFYAGSITHP